MKCRLHSRPERGIALVITLVMLAIVTVMAIVFLGVSRRERASVKVFEDISTANAMADAALERAKAEALARMAGQGSKLYYDLFNSRSFENPNGFNTSQSLGSLPDPQNVSYLDRNKVLLNGTPYLRMLANMQYDPRVPVFIETNANRGLDFRYFLDFDRNRLFETNGVVPLLDTNGTQIEIRGEKQFGDLVGDPEWIGVLERPDYPHSETNRFIGRMAYLVLPAGKTLDVNFIHNQANPLGAQRLDTITAANGYTRNQGVGSWEINLAAFFRELSPMNWPQATYNYRPGQLPTGAAFDNARAFLALRYSNRGFLANASRALSADPENIVQRNIIDWDQVDNYGDGPFPTPGQEIFGVKSLALRRDDDVPNVRPWPGSPTTNAVTDLQQVFNVSSGDFTNRLLAPLRRRSTEDRYQFYRMAAQLGVDSTPAIKGKLHLNFDNAPGKITNNAIAWTTNSALRFFTTAADLMLRASIDRVVTITNSNQAFFWGRQFGTYYMIGDTLVSTNFSLNNIQVYAPFHPNYPSIRQNEYTPAIHRILQVAVNIFDNMTNRPYGQSGTKQYLPTVFRPVYTKTTTNLYVSGWQEVTNASQVASGWTMDLADVFRTNAVRANSVLSNNVNFFGEHLVIGAKKGHPNFNELALQTSTEIARKLEVVKPSAGAQPITNQMFLFSLEQRWGMEGWNSYTNKYDRPVSILGEVQSTIAIKDGTNALQAPLQIWRTSASGVHTMAQGWAGYTNASTTNFAVILRTNFNLLQDVAYTKLDGFRSTNQARFTLLEKTPDFVISTTNRVRYFMVDQATKRIVDFVSFDNLVTTMDLSKELHAPPTQSSSQFGNANSGNNEDIYWDSTPVPGTPGLTRGITNQLAASAGELEVSSAVWKAFRHSTAIQKDDDKNGAISAWRKFMGLPLSATNKPVGPLVDLRRQSPFVPSRRVEQLLSWQVNDPLVHFMWQDIAPIPGTDSARKRPILDPPGPSPWNIGSFNVPGYRPWGGSPAQQAGGSTGDKAAFSIGVKDAGIRRSDDWEFPIDTGGTNFHFFANVGELGRIHRGTPWQTLYLKSIYTMQATATGMVAVPLPGVHPTDWKNWAGSAGTHPMNDWKLMDVFTTAPNENATRGLLSVNQTNRAAWSAVLSGVIVPTNVVENSTARSFGVHEGADPATAYKATYILPATPAGIAAIVESINFARRKQLDIVPNPNAAANPRVSWDFAVRRNPITGGTNMVFERLGEILSAPGLTVQSPYLNFEGDQMRSVVTDRALEYIPQQIMSLLQRDEPRFVVYAFGQSLKPAPRSLTSDPNFYHMCTNYQITGEMTTKTVFRVEGELPIPGDPATQNKPVHAVVESYEILPPVE